MSTPAFHPPDEAAMRRLLIYCAGQPTGIILALAWRAGLTRDEISRLTWDSVDFDAGAHAPKLHLPDRDVPLEGDVVELLHRWKRRCEKFSPYVAVSDRLRQRMTPQSLSNLARRALDREGMKDVRLQDLRFDFIRRQFREHDWPYALRVSGVSLSYYRSSLAFLGRDGPPRDVSEPPLPSPEAPEPPDDKELRIWRVMQAERDTPAGLALWLGKELGLQGEEMLRLTWADVDFDAGIVRLPDRELALPMNVRWALEAERGRRVLGDDPHLLLTPRSRRPLTWARLSALVREALIRGGVEDLTLSDIRRSAGRDEQRRRLLDSVAERGSVTCRETAVLLCVPETTARRLLTDAAEDGALVRAGMRWYVAGSVVPPERQREAILALAAENGSVTRQEAAALLRIGPRQTGRVLKAMTEDGALVLLPRARRYVLPGEIE